MRLGRRPRTSGSGRDQIVAYDRFRAAAFFAGAFLAAGFTRTRIVLPAPCLTSRKDCARASELSFGKP